MKTIFIQHIETLWTKQSRGGEAARKRNSVPEAVEIPLIVAESPFVLHRATFLEVSSFAQKDHLLTTDTFSGLELSDLSLTVTDEALKIRFYRDGYNAATLSPFPYKEPFLIEEPMKWGRIAYNARYSAEYTGNWWYAKHVYNIGWLDKCPRIFF